jgi:hypothetical protein
LAAYLSAGQRIWRRQPVVLAAVMPQVKCSVAGIHPGSRDSVAPDPKVRLRPASNEESDIFDGESARPGLARPTTSLRRNRHLRWIPTSRKQSRLRGFSLRGDAGMTSAEMAVWAPVSLVGVLLIVQLTAWALAQLAGSYAANHALQATRVQGGTAAAGQADAATILVQIDGNLIGRQQITATRTAGQATVRIRGSVIRIVPFLTLPVSVEASGPVEALTPQGLQFLNPETRHASPSASGRS